MDGTIYGLYFEDELRYIGQTSTKLQGRLADHRRAARQGWDSAVYRWMRSVGPEHVVARAIATVPVKDLTAVEQSMIATAVKVGVDLLNTQYNPVAPARGWTRVGEEAARSLLTDAQVMEARTEWAERWTSAAALAERYGVSRSTMALIVKGKSYGHLPVLERPAVRPCSVEGCDRPAVERSGGLCGAHLSRKRRHGSVDAPVRAQRKNDEVCGHGHPLTVDNRTSYRRKNGTVGFLCRRCCATAERRSKGWAREQPKRTSDERCTRGHDLTDPANRVYRSGGFTCRACENELRRARRRRSA